MGMHGKLSKYHPIKVDGERGECPYHWTLRTNHSTADTMPLIQCKGPHSVNTGSIKVSWSHLHCPTETMTVLSWKALFALAHQHPGFLLIFIWTRHIFTKNTMKPRICCHNEVLSDICFLCRG